MSEKEISALISLLDDEDNEIVDHIEKKILSLGEELIPYLEKEWEKNFNPIVQKRIEELIHTVQFEVVKARIQSWKHSQSHDLIEGLWSVATYQYPDLELDDIYDQINLLWAEINKSFDPTLSPTEQVKAINEFIFSTVRFGANTKNFHSPSNSMINTVLETKKGNPISLCVIYMVIAQKLGMPVSGVNLPNLFVLIYESPEETFYINVFNRGLIFKKEDITTYIAQLKLEQNRKYYLPCSNTDIIVRTLRNLIVSFEKLGDEHKVDEIKQLMAILLDY